MSNSSDNERVISRDKVVKDLLKFGLILLAWDQLWGVLEALLKRVG